MAKKTCDWCGTAEGEIRVQSEGYGSLVDPTYTCEDCFYPDDTGPCWDDLPLANDKETTHAP